MCEGSVVGIRLCFAERKSRDIHPCFFFLFFALQCTENSPPRRVTWRRLFSPTQRHGGGFVLACIRAAAWRFIGHVVSGAKLRR